jgi:hypothetical protein
MASLVTDNRTRNRANSRTDTGFIDRVFVIARGASRKHRRCRHHKNDLLFHRLNSFSFVKSNGFIMEVFILKDPVRIRRVLIVDVDKSIKNGSNRGL